MKNFKLQMEEEFNKAIEIIENNPDICYSGKMDFKTIKKLVDQIEILVNEKYDHRSSQRRVYHTTVEMLQNLRNHGLFDLERIASFKSKITENKCYLLTKNILHTNKTYSFDAKLIELNKISNDSKKIKQLYRDKASGKDLPKNILFERIRGLGLISIVKLSKNKILYNLEKIDDQNSRISLIATVDIKKP